MFVITIRDQTFGMSFSIHPISAATKDEQLLDALLRFTHDVDHEIDPNHPPLSSTRLRTRLIDDPVFGQRVLVATEAGSVLGTNTRYLNRLDAHREKAEAVITVHPQARRRGIGTALLPTTLRMTMSSGTGTDGRRATFEQWRHSLNDGT